jgi:pimeloyl-ACP methyl ester carboxylesterase
MAVPHIVYVHGLNCSGTIFSHLRSNLPKHTATFIEYDSAQSIEASVEAAIRVIPALKPLTIIGHSLGGLVGHLLCTRNIASLNVEKFVSISTPFAGSGVAGILRWLYPAFHVLKDLTPNSKILKEIQASSLTIPFLSLVSMTGNLPFISGQNDGIVTIQSQMAVSATKRVEIEANHFEAVQSQATIEEIKRFVF